MSSNSSYIITEVLDTQEIKRFNEFPMRLYKEDPNWIRPLDASVEEIFDKKVNKNLLNGDIKRWIITDNSGNCAGRIAAFFTEESFRQHGQPTGGVGFFDSINVEEVAFMLFDTAKEWLKSKNVEAMDGPINPGMRDAFWGCLADGFHEPVFNMPYNFPFSKRERVSIN